MPALSAAPQPPARPAGEQARVCAHCGVDGGPSAALLVDRSPSSVGAPAPGAPHADKHAHGRSCGKPCKATAAAAAEAEPVTPDGEAAGSGTVAAPPFAFTTAAPAAAAPWAPPPRADASLSPQAGSLWALALCPASGALYAGGRGASLRWDVAAARGGAAAAASETAAPAAAAPFALLHRGGEGAYALALSPDGATLYAGCGDGAVRALDAASGDVRATFGDADDDPDEACGVYALALNASTGILYAGAEDGTIRGWATRGAREGTCAEALDGHASAVTALVVVSGGASADEKGTNDAAGGVTLVSGCEDGALCGWRVGGDGGGDGAAPAWRLEGAHGAGVTALCWDGASGVIFSASWDGAVRAVRACDGSAVHAWPRLASAPGADSAEPSPVVPITALARGAGTALWAGAHDGAILRLDTATRAVTRPLPAAHGRRGVTALAASSDGERLFSAGLDRIARAWTVAPPAAWSHAAHARFPDPFRAALAQLRRGMGDAGCPLGAALGSLDANTRGGLFDAIAASLASQAYAAPPRKADAPADAPAAE
jgi:hypothetical protein